MSQDVDGNRKHIAGLSPIGVWDFEMETDKSITIESLDRPGPYAYEYVECALANCRNILMVCGSGVSLAAGLSPLYGPHGLQAKNFKLAGRSIAGDELFTTKSLLSSDRTSLLFRILAEQRELARTAAPTSFHALLDDMYRRNVLRKCYTENVDELEGKLTPSLLTEATGPVVVQILGNNSHLRCEDCNRTFPCEEYQAKLLEGMDVACPYCDNGAGASQHVLRRSQRTRQSKARPCLPLIDEMEYDGSEETPALDGTPDVMLVVGTALKLKRVEQLVKGLSEALRDVGRRVIYIGLDRLSKKTWGDYIDIFVYVDVQEWAKRQLDAPLPDDAGSPPGWGILDSFFVPPPESFSLSGTIDDFLHSGSPNACSVCFLNDPENVYACRACHKGYCMQAGDSKGVVNCVQLCKLAPIPGLEGASVADLAKTFLCPTCHIRKPGEIYPHLVRAAPFHAPDPPRSPKIVIFLFHILQFRSVADNMAKQIAYTWFERGWECRVIAIGLDDLENETPVDFNLGGSSWTYRTYKVFVVYITHALSSDYTLQISGAKSVPVDVFLDITFKVMKPVLTDAISSHAALLCCGHLFHSVRQTALLQAYITSASPFQHLVGFFNARLCPAMMSSLLSWVVVESLGLDEDFESVLVEQWMRDEMASAHTDLIVLSPGFSPQVYCFAPFQSRPLGKDLPSIVHSCFCSSSENPSSSTPGKKWIVKHSIRKQKGEQRCNDLSQVDVWIRCSRCQNQWTLDTRDLPGKLFAVGGLHYVQLPYFGSELESQM